MASSIRLEQTDRKCYYKIPFYSALQRERHLFPCSSFFSLGVINDLLRTILKNQTAPLVNSYLLLNDQFNASYWNDDSYLNDFFFLVSE